MSLKSGNHTGSMYDTWVILQHGIYTVAVSGQQTNADSLAVFLAPRLASYSQLCLCVDECEQTFLHAVSVRSKHTAAVVLLDACSRAQSAGICCCCYEKRVRGASRRKTKSPAEDSAKLNAFPDRFADAG